MPDDYKYTAVSKKTGKRIGSNDGKNWVPIVPSIYERLTETRLPQDRETVPQQILREVGNIGGAALSLPGQIYQTVKDPWATGESMGKSVREFIKKPPTWEQTKYVLPTALSTSIGQVAGGEALGAATGLAGKGAFKVAEKVPGLQRSLQEAVVTKAKIESAAKEHEANLAEIEKAYEEKVQEVGKKTAEDEAAYKLKVQHTKDDFARKTAKYQTESVKASAKETAAATKKEYTTLPRSGPVYKRLTGMADQVAEDVQNLDQTIRATYNARYDAFRMAMKDANGNPFEGNFDVVQQAVVDAEDNILKGSPENIAIFRNILKEGEDPMLAEASVFRGGRGVDVKEVLGEMRTEGERARFLRGLKEEGALAEERESFGRVKEGTTLPIDQMQGYSTELGNKIYRGSTPSGDVRRALKSVKDATDKEIYRVAEENGQGAIKKRLDSDWAEYMSDFYDSDGALYKMKTAINPDRRLSVLTGGDGARVVDSLGHYGSFSPNIGLVGRVRSLTKQLRELPGVEGQPPKKPEPFKYPARPKAREMPKRPKTDPFSIPGYRREQVEKLANDLARITRWDWASVLWGLEDLLTGKPPIPFAYPASRMLGSRLLSNPRVVEYLSRELPEAVK
jgi:hypothetical protein